MSDRWDEAGGKLCAEIEGWCPNDPRVPDSEIDVKKGRNCQKAAAYAKAMRKAYRTGVYDGATGAKGDPQ